MRFLISVRRDLRAQSMMKRTECFSFVKISEIRIHPIDVIRVTAKVELGTRKVRVASTRTGGVLSIECQGQIFNDHWRF